MAGRHPLTKALGLVAPGESISAEQENILRRIATQQLDLVDCIQDSTGIRQARPTVSAGGCNTIRFEICEPDCETCSAEVIILSRPPGGDVEGEANGKVTVYDKIGCFLNEVNDDLVGRRGYATYLEADSDPTVCEEGQVFMENCEDMPLAAWEIIHLCPMREEC